MKMMGLLFVAIFVSGTQLAYAAADPKVTICHFPPGNPSNYQTITIGSSALKAHLAHGDFGGACADDCNLVSNACDDGNLCTGDLCNRDGTCSHTPVDCNDSNTCTEDTCLPATGCVNTAVPDRGCDDQNAGTDRDQCNASWSCNGTPIAGYCDTDADCSETDLCTTDTCDLSTNKCKNTQLVCTPTSACVTASCASGSGSCEEAPISCEDRNACTDDSCDTANGCQHTQKAGCCRSNNDCRALFQTCDIPAGNSTGTCIAAASPACQTFRDGSWWGTGNPTLTIDINSALTTTPPPPPISSTPHVFCRRPSYVQRGRGRWVSFGY